MKFFIILVAVFLLSKDKQKSTDLTVTITNIKNDSGVLRALLFKGEEGFPDNTDKAFKNASVSIKGNRASIVFKDIPEGTYAISLFHDSLNTGKLRTNALGIPRDGYGFSNNASGTFGPPSYKNAAFELTADQNEVSIKLK
ncbi:DUF2141 domain-containing protein [Mongoliibacter ruber]|uniref:Uncharacterized protein (DUF2141 family) n=1 Tax=Mongoliibacter ruber TaxID=1750599 RepID=A0A2T0WKB0_9BACT|nr:DUF2141 domain-containing protein [Mongoliibacter ruber]PRY86944.1 uncharacterized protein (DUF2141 family) [Mongoliibacter ruber]